MFTKLVKTHDIKGAGYKKVTDWEAILAAIFFIVIGIGVLSAIFG